MQLTRKGIESPEWKAKGYSMPQFNIETVQKNTHENPYWVHFGGGNIFRAYQANLVQNLLNQGVVDRGIIVADFADLILNVYRPHDNIQILVTLKSNGSVDKTIIGSVMESLCVNKGNENNDYARLREIFRNKSLQMISFSITEKGYSLRTSGEQSDFQPDVLYDFEHGPESPKTYFGKVVSLLYDRFLAGELPLALVSMDNCSHNGDKVFSAVKGFAEEWEKRNLVNKGFLNYVTTPTKLSFPWTMIDKITPRPHSNVEKILKEDGITDLINMVTGAKVYSAPFVNSEECQYLVIEDKFPNGRPPLEKVGVYFTNRETVDKVEKMKVCTCLNPLHTCLAIFGCLLGFNLISKEMEDDDLVLLIKLLGYKEGLPVVVDPKIISPQKFIDEVVQIRFPNPFMPDTPQRIACDTSQKIPIRYGETVKSYLGRPDLDLGSLNAIPLVFAGWLRYLVGIDDQGNQMELSPDPLLDEVRAGLKTLKLGQKFDVHEVCKPLLSRADIFAVDLYTTVLAKKAESFFEKMMMEKGAVRKTIKEVLN